MTRHSKHYRAGPDKTEVASLVTTSHTKGILETMFKDDKALDTTLMALTAMITAIVISIGLMVLHHVDEGDDLLSPEIIMAMIGLPGLFAAYAVGKRHGENGNGNGNGNHSNGDK